MELTNECGNHLVTSGQLTVGSGESEHSTQGVLVGLDQADHGFIEDLGEMGGWVGWIEQKEAVGMSYRELGVGGWVGEWVGGWFTLAANCSSTARYLVTTAVAASTSSLASCLFGREGGWVGGWLSELFSMC